MGLKIVHTADVLLGHSFEGTGLLPEEGALWRQEIWQTLDQICQRAKEERADLLLICGNLMEGNLSPSEKERCADLFCGIQPTRVVWILGKEDPKEDEGKWPENVYRVPPGFHRYEFSELNAVLWAESWAKETWPEGFSGYVPPEEDEKYRILMLHGESGQEASFDHPIDMQAVRQMGIDYCALGHRANPLCWGGEGRTWAAYAGSPAPHSFEEEGSPGFWVVELEKAGGRCLSRMERVSLRHRNFVTKELSLRGEKNTEEIGDRIAEIFPGVSRRRDFCRVIMTGFRGGFVPLDPEKLRSALVPGRFFSLTIQDRTETELSYDRIREQNPENLLGKYIKTMQDRIRVAGDEGERRLLETALAAGVEALYHSQEKGG